MLPVISVGLLVQWKFELSDESTWNTREGMHMPLSCSLIKRVVFLRQTACSLQETDSLNYEHCYEFLD